MNYNDLAIFVSVAHTLSFSATAERLALPPSRISRRIAELEERLGTKLFERTTRRVRLTHEGRELLDRCGAPMEALEALMQGATRADTASKGAIRLTAPALAARTSIGPRLIAFMAENPGISVELVTSNAHLDFVRDDIDLAFRLGPIDGDGLIVRRLWSVPYALCASRRLLAEHGVAGPAEADAILDLPAISTGQAWRFLERPAFIPRNVRHVIDDLAVALAAVRAGLGIGLLPRALPAKDEVIEVDGLTPQARDMNAVYPSRRLLPARVRALIDHMATGAH